MMSKPVSFWGTRAMGAMDGNLIPLLGVMASLLGVMASDSMLTWEVKYNLVAHFVPSVPSRKAQCVNYRFEIMEMHIDAHCFMLMVAHTFEERWCTCFAMRALPPLESAILDNITRVQPCCDRLITLSSYKNMSSIPPKAYGSHFHSSSSESNSTFVPPGT